MPTMDLTEEEADLIEKMRELEDNEEEAMAWFRTRLYFKNNGNEKGQHIAEIVREEVHPDAPLIVPLYRSCLVMVEPERTGHDAEFLVYHDPNWMGCDITPETLDRFKNHLAIVGQRSGFDVYVDDEEWRSPTLRESMHKTMTDHLSERLRDIRDTLIEEYDVPEELLKVDIPHVTEEDIEDANLLVDAVDDEG